MRGEVIADRTRQLDAPRCTPPPGGPPRITRPEIPRGSFVSRRKVAGDNGRLSSAFLIVLWGAVVIPEGGDPRPRIEAFLRQKKIPLAEKREMKNMHHADERSRALVFPRPINAFFFVSFQCSSGVLAAPRRRGNIPRYR